jgi:hypothetical protein
MGKDVIAHNNTLGIPGQPHGPSTDNDRHSLIESPHDSLNMHNDYEAPTEPARPLDKINLSAMKGEKLEKTLNIAGLNVNGIMSKLRLGILQDFVKSFDIVCVSESKTDHADELNINISGYTPVCMHRQKYTHKSGGIMTLVKNTIINHVKPLTSYNSNCVQWFQVESPVIGEAFILGSVYLPPIDSNYHTGDEFESITEDMISIFADHELPFWLMGDFNARSGALSDIVDFNEFLSDSVGLCDKNNQFLSSEDLDNLGIKAQRTTSDSEVNRNGKKLLELCHVAKLLIVNGRVGQDANYGKTTCAEVSVIDYMIGSPVLFSYIENFFVDIFDPLLSDKHSPIICRLSSPYDSHSKPCPALPSETSSKSSAHTTVHKTNWSPGKQDVFKNSFDIETINLLLQELQNVNPADTSQEVINHFSSKVNNCYISTGINSGMTRKITIRPNQNSRQRVNKPYFTKECASRRREYYKAKKHHRQVKNVDTKNILTMASKQYKKTLLTAHNKFHKNLHQKLRNLKSQNPKDYWSIINKACDAKEKIGRISTNTFLEHFQKLNIPSNANTSEGIPHSNTQKLSSSDVAQHNTLPFNADFTREELEKAAKKLKNGKAAGIDGILNEFLKNSPPVLLDFLVKYFNLILSTGIIPDDWTTGVVVPLYKKKGDPNNPDNYRGITLLSCMGKLFTRLINSRLSNYLEANHIIGEEQAAFREGYATTDHIFTLHAAIELLLQKNKRIYCAFVDYKKAFDSIDRTALWSKLVNSGIKGRVLDVIQNLYAKAKSCVRNNNSLSDFFSCKVGVRQGENLSPLLFTLFLNDLQGCINDYAQGIEIGADSDLEAHLRLFVLLYADDTIILGDSPNDLQNALHGLYAYCDEWQLQVNTSKTKIVIFSRGWIKRLPSFTFGEDSIEVQHDYNYLGATFNYNGSFQKHVSKQASLAKRALFSLLSKIRKLCLPIDIARHLFDTCITPILTYGCETWGFANLQALESVQACFYKYLLKLNRSTASCIVLGEVGSPKIEQIVKQRVCNFWARIVSGSGTKISAIMYRILRNLADSGAYKSKWISYVESTMNNSGLGYIWLNEDPHNITWFKETLKQRLSDIYLQKWSEEISNSGHCSTYKVIKEDYKLEDYLLKLDMRSALTLCRFRAGSTKLPVVVGRYKKIERHDRLCHLCSNHEIGDETHYILKCPAMDEPRTKLLPQYYWRHPTITKMKELFSDKNVKTLKNVVSLINIVNASLDPSKQTYFKPLPI